MNWKCFGPLVLTVGMLFSCCGWAPLPNQDDSLEKIIRSRPDPQEHVFEFSPILDIYQENLSQQYLFLKEKHGFEVVVVSLPSLEGKQIGAVAAEMFSNWDIGRENNGNGVLLLVAVEDQLVRLEVSHSLEGVLTDAFCGYCERTYFQPYVARGYLGKGVNVLLNLLKHRFEATQDDKNIQDEIIRKLTYLSAGGGVSRDMSAAQEKALDSATVEKYREYFVPQDDVFSAYVHWSEMRALGMPGSECSLLTEESRVKLKYSVQVPDVTRVRAKYNDLRSFMIFESPTHAVWVDDRNITTTPPVFFERGKGGWQVDYWRMKQFIWHDGSGQWVLLGGRHPYLWAFKEEEYGLRKFCRGNNLFSDYGRFSQVRENYEQEINRLEKEIKSSPVNVDLIIDLAEIFMDLFITEPALELCQKALGVDPGCKKAVKYLGLLYRDHGLSADKAIEYLTRYTELAPQDARGYLHLSFAYRLKAEQKKAIEGRDNTREYEQAIKHMKTYSSLAEETWFSYKKIAFYYYKLKKYRQARKYLLHVIKDYPNDKWAPRFLKKLYSKTWYGFSYKTVFVVLLGFVASGICLGVFFMRKTKLSVG